MQCKNPPGWQAAYNLGPRSQLELIVLQGLRLCGYTGLIMFRHSAFATLLWVLAVALLPVRMANAHLHLCLDGQEQPVSLHVQDVATHSGTEATTDQGHNDRDVDVSASMLTAKLSAGMDDAPSALLHLYVLTALLPVERLTFSLIDLPSAELTSVVTLRPPVRGPPV